MRRTAVRAAESYSRATMAQQRQQQASQSASQHRSTSVLASLMRMRSQFVRLRGTQQQQVVRTVLTRNGKSRVFDSKDAPCPLPSNTAEGSADAAVEAEVSPGARGTCSSSSVLQAGVLLCTEAQRLLKSEARANDLLSDVAVSSPLYAAEAGKLLAIAAVFGASTTYPRVQEICAWVRANTDALRTPRQIMSLCVPLVNLTDGATAGVSFVLEVLYEPLLLALQEVGASTTSSNNHLNDATQSESVAPSSLDEGGAGNASNNEQQLVAVTSAFGMVAKWAAAFPIRAAEVVAKDGSLSNGDTPSTSAVALLQEDRARMRRIGEASVAALVRLTSDRCGGDSRDGSDDSGSGDGRSHDMVYTVLQQLAVSDVVLWLQCLHGVEKAYSVLVTKAENDEAMRRLLLCYRVLLPLMRCILNTAFGRATVTKGAATDGNLTRSISTSTLVTSSDISNTGSSACIRVQDVADLVQAGLFASVEPVHTELVLKHGLRALSGVLGAATVREMCLVTQVVNKVRLQRPAALSAAQVRAIMAALRPRLFLLCEAQAYQFRPQECSLLLSQLSRWEEVPEVTVSADVVELLSQRFGEQISGVESAQLVPFMQALARMEERHRRADQCDNAGTVNEQVNGKEAADLLTSKKNTSSDSNAAAAAASVRQHRRHRTKAVRYAYSSTARVIAQCAQRIAMLASVEGMDSVSTPPPTQLQQRTRASEGATATVTNNTSKAKTPRLSPFDAAQLISALVQLSSPQVEFVFAKVEPLLACAVAFENPAPLLTRTSSQSELQARVAVQETVVRFVDFMTKAHPIESLSSAAVHRAKALLMKMKRTLASVVRQAQRPKDLVMVAPLVRHQLLDKRPVRPDIDTYDDFHPHPSPKSQTVPSKSPTWRRADVRLAAHFAERASSLAAACNGLELGALAITIGILTSVGVLPAAASRQATLSLWTRCAHGLEAASATTPTNDTDKNVVTHLTSAATSITLSVDDCKKLMDGLRSVFPTLPSVYQATLPPIVFLNTFAALCTDQLTSTTAMDAATADGNDNIVRGTVRSYEKTLADLCRCTALGRSVVSCFSVCSASPMASSNNEPATGSLTHSQEEREARQQAWCTVAEAYLEVVGALMESYATEAALSESWWAAEVINDNNSVARQQPPTVPLEVLSMSARVVAQLQRLVHRHDGSATRKSNSSVETDSEDTGDAIEGLAEEPNIGDTCSFTKVEMEGEADELNSDAHRSLTTIDAAVSEVLGVLGDTIALLSKQQRQLNGNSSVATSYSTGDAVLTSLPTDVNLDTPAETTVRPKHLLMLLQAFETAHFRHPEMLYGILPELRSCADQLDPLELSLLIRALSQLGAWNSRLLRVLATAVEAKMQTCELRQCHTLLRGLCRSGCVSPDTFVEVRGSVYKDWERAGTRRGDAPLEPLQQLAESVLCRMDALVRTKNAFFNLTKTATVADLVSVVSALRFFHVPPPSTYDAFVVLAVRQLAVAHTTLPTTTAVQYAIILLSAVPQLRKPEQQRVSVSTVWTVVHRALTLTPRRFAHVNEDSTVNDDVLSLQTCWQLWRLACQHTLQYGSDVTRLLFEVVGHGGSKRSATLFSHIQERLDLLVEAYAWGPAPITDRSTDKSAIANVKAGFGALPALSMTGEAALRCYGSHAAPSLARNDRDLSEHLCYPLRLARRVTELLQERNDLSPLVRTSLLTAPAAHVKQYIRLIACLLRADLWRSSSISAESQLLLITAIQHLWEHAGLHGLLRSSPEAFTTEELVALAAAAAHLQQVSGATAYRDDYVAALRQLAEDKTEWRLAAAVDVWALFTRFVEAPSSQSSASLVRFGDLGGSTDELLAALAKSGGIVIAAFLQAQSAATVARARLVRELLRLFQTSGGTSIESFLKADVKCSVQTSAETTDSSVELSHEARFRQHYCELQNCVTACLATQRRR